MGAKKVLKLILTIIITIAIATVIISVCKQAYDKTNLEDLRTNMLLIQGKAKTYTENVSVETANLNEEKEEDNTKIEEVKDQKLKGTALGDCDEKIKNAASKSGIEDVKDFYYLSQQDLNDMGININVKEDEYYLVKYNFEDTEVVYTKGYKHKEKIYYKLSEIKDIEL